MCCEGGQGERRRLGVIATQHSVLTALGSRVFCLFCCCCCSQFRIIFQNVRVCFIWIRYARENRVLTTHKSRMCLSVASVGHEWPWICALKSLGWARVIWKTGCCPRSRSPHPPTPHNVTHVIQGKARAHTVWHQYRCRSCQNDAEVHDEVP